jgi:hypothetical protein
MTLKVIAAIIGRKLIPIPDFGPIEKSENVKPPRGATTNSKCCPPCHTSDKLAKDAKKYVRTPV